MLGHLLDSVDFGARLGNDQNLEKLLFCWKKLKNMSAEINFKSLEECLNKYIPENELKEVKRILYGRSDEWVSFYQCNIFLIFNNTSRNSIKLPESATQLAKANNFELKAYKFEAQKEDVRQQRVVRVGAIQNSIAVPTTEPVSVQIKAIYEKIGKIIDGAALAGVNVLCLQEAWSEMTKI